MGAGNTAAAANARHPLKTHIFTILVILANTLGNFLLSWGMKHRGEVLNFTVLAYLRAFLNPWVALGITLLVVWMLMRMALLGWADLSYVVPVTALGYVLNAIMGRLFLREVISMDRWAGTVLIVMGTVLVGLGSPHTTPSGDKP